MNHIIFKMIPWNSEYCKIYLHTMSYYFRIYISFEINGGGNSSHCCDSKVTLCLVYSLLSEFNVLIDTTKLVFIIIITS